MIKISQLWYSKKESEWHRALEKYWDYVKPANLELEREHNELNREEIEELDPEEWYNFLYDSYFKWKYTALNRYATTTLQLRKYLDNDQLDKLHNIKQRLFRLGASNIRSGLLTASEIYGLGIAGASGLLAILFPEAFATVDQFAVKALQQIPGLNEEKEIQKIKPDSISPADGVLMI